MFVVRLIVHLSPLIPIALGYHYAGVATLLFVALLYIKTFKFQQRLAQINDVSGVQSEAYLDNKKMMAYWSYLTFLPRPHQDKSLNP
jgi:hypothetical protein